MYKIYKIVDNTNDNVYIGITTQNLHTRLSHHKHNLKCMSREIIKNGDYNILLIEETDDKTRERYYIENIDCINKYIPGQTKQEYYVKNKNKINEYNNIWYKNNKEKKQIKNKEWIKNNTDKVKKNTQRRTDWEKSMGGRARETYNMSLLKIDIDLFN